MLCDGELSADDHLEQLAAIRSEIGTIRDKLQEAHAAELESLSASQAAKLAKVYEQHTKELYLMQNELNRAQDLAKDKGDRVQEVSGETTRLQQEIERLQKELVTALFFDGDGTLSEELRKARAAEESMREELEGLKQVRPDFSTDFAQLMIG